MEASQKERKGKVEIDYMMAASTDIFKIKSKIVDDIMEEIQPVFGVDRYGGTIW